jgi:hypothetical protein
VCLDAADAAFLVDALDRLPGAEERNSPATMILNGKVAVRAQGEEDEKPTELVLARSRYTGKPVRFQTCRDFLGRALKMGFTAIEIVNAKSPILCRDAHRRYLWQPLTCDGPEPELATDVVRVESCPTMPPAIPGGLSPKASEVVNERRNRSNGHPTSNGESNGHTTTNVLPNPAPDQPERTGLAALIQEAEAIHTELGTLRARAGHLVVSLRRYRKRERLVATTLASLKELKLHTE